MADEDEAAFEADLVAQAAAGDEAARTELRKPRRAPKAEPETKPRAREATQGGVLVTALRRVYINGEHTVDNRVAKLEPGGTAELRPDAAKLYAEGGHVRLA